MKSKHYPNYAWILLNWSDQWWMEYDEYLNDTNCTLPNINTVLNRSLILTPYPSSEVGSSQCMPLLLHYIV